MEARPKLTIELTKVDKTIETVCLITLIVLWTGTMAGFPKLPEQIPSHFNAAGQVDAYSEKTSIFILPIIATILYIGMTILNKYPHIYNYPSTITGNNGMRLYTSSTRLIRILKLAVVIFFTGIVFLTYKPVFTHDKGLGAWFLPVALALMLVRIYSIYLSHLIPNISIKSTDEYPIFAKPETLVIVKRLHIKRRLSLCIIINSQL